MEGKDLEGKVGVGKVVWNKEEPFYKGTLPRTDKATEEDVIVMRNVDYQMFVRGYLELIFSQVTDMPFKLAKQFPEEIIFHPKDGEPVNLFLEHRFYCFDPTKAMIVIYKSVDEALNEGEL